MKTKTLPAASAVETPAAASNEVVLVLLVAPFEFYQAGSVLRLTAADAAELLADPERAQIATQAQADMASPSFFFDLVPTPTQVEELGASEVVIEPAASDAAPSPDTPA